MNEQFKPEVQKFSTPHEELQYLREQIAIKEKALAEAGKTPEKEVVIHEEIHDYSKQENVLHDDYKIPESHTDQIVLNLAPEKHDEKMGELLGILKERGVKNALTVVEKMNDPHIEDDFHRFLVQYIKKGYPIDLKEKDPVFRALKMTLFEVSMPEAVKSQERQKTLRELVSSMEQFYAGMLSVADSQNRDRYIAIELANANHSEESIFYVAVPDEKKELFEKHILSLFPTAKIVEKFDDYNIFNESGVSVGSYATIEKNPIFQLKSYEKFDTDPMNVVYNSFSKIDKDGEGAAIQIIFRPCGDSYIKSYKNAVEQIQKGVPLKEAIDIQHTFWGELGKVGREFFKSAKDMSKDSKDPNKDKKPVDENALKSIQEKISSPIIECCLRVVASSKTVTEATDILSDIESGFNQFENTGYSKINFTRVSGGSISQFLEHFSFREFSQKHVFPINLRELTTVMHFHSDAILAAPQLKTAKAGTSPAPVGLLTSGVLLGVNKDRNIETKIYMGKEDRLRHFYVIGQTGTGKTTLLKNMIVQDIKNGDGVCMIDPHGTDIQDILASIPKERYEDVIYFDPSFTDRPMALNMLEYDPRFPEQKTFVVNEMLAIFNKLFDMKVAGGPMFEQYFRNATMLVIEDPETGCTLLDVSRVLADKAYRQLKLSRCKNPVVVQFWKEVAEKAGGEASLANIIPYITSKFDVFLSNEIMRPIVAQEHSSFNFREVMDNKKILLVNLAKGRLGDINANLIGLIVVGKILMATLSRVDVYGKEISDFYLYIDEFQNVTTDSISTILSEARKYRLGLNVAHQFIAQLEEKIRDSVFGNVGSIAAFRVGSDDAEYLEKQFSGIFTAKDLMNVDNRNAYIRMLSEGKPVKPFNIETLPPPPKNPEIVENLKQLSYMKFGRNKAEVEAEIMARYEKKTPSPAIPPATSTPQL